MTRRVNKALELLADAIIKRRKEERPPRPGSSGVKSRLARSTNRRTMRRAGRTRARIVLAAALILGAALPAQADEGDLDQSFGDQGVFQIDLNPAGSENIRALTISDDGTIYAVETRTAQVLALRTDGTPDTSYGTDGAALVHPDWSLTPREGVLDSSGRLVLAGFRSEGGGIFYPWVTRMDPSGVIDSSFADDGHFFLDSITGEFGSVWVTGDGKILAVGGQQSGDIVAVRLLTDGTLDPSFGSGGISIVPAVFPLAEAPPIWGAAGPEGDIFVTSATPADGSGSDLFVRRLHSNGTLDEEFGTVILDIEARDQASGIAVTPTGRIVVAGYSTESDAVVRSVVARLLPNGDLDKSFRFSGTAVYDDLGGYPRVHDVALDASGRIVLAGDTEEGVGFVARLRVNGHLDPEFAGGGVSVVGLPGSGTRFSSVEVQPDGRIVAGGDGPGVGGRDSLVARFEGSIPDVSFVDDDGSTFERDIEKLGAHGITRGCNPPANDRFCPDDPVTRGQMAAFLVRALGYTDDGGGDLFTDDDSSTFQRDIDRLGTAGVTRGCNPPVNDRFCPDDLVTRGQMAAFLVRALGYTDDGGGDLFTDDDGSTFEADIDRLGAAGVTRGCNPPVNDRFCPDDPVTRGQMAAFIVRALGLP